MVDCIYDVCEWNEVYLRHEHHRHTASNAHTEACAFQLVSSAFSFSSSHFIYLYSFVIYARAAPFFCIHFHAVVAAFFLPFVYLVFLFFCTMCYCWLWLFGVLLSSWSMWVNTELIIISHPIGDKYDDKMTLRRIEMSLFPSLFFCITQN